jgi:outer membrane protein assembly factor BamD (BamD/ComL family)
MCARFWQNIMADMNRDTENKEIVDSSAPVHVDDQFHIWFEKNRNTVIFTCAAVIILAAIFCFWYWKTSTREADAATALTKAKTIPEWEQVTSTYPGSKAAPLALILAADGYFSEGKYKEAQAAYEKFLQQYPNDELAASAQFGRASCLEAQARSQDEYARAGAAYEALLSNYKDTFHAGEAQIAIARCAEAQGDLQKAKQTLENVRASMAGSQWAREAATREAILSRKMAPAAPQQPNIPSLVLPGSTPAPTRPTPTPPPQSPK